jgi:hypothetical protein
MAEAAVYAGARFYAGYPITPSSEIAEESSRVMLQVDGVFMQMEDEIASIAAVIGASLAGAKSFTATSGPGFSLMQEIRGYMDDRFRPPISSSPRRRILFGVSPRRSNPKDCSSSTATWLSRLRLGSSGFSVCRRPPFPAIH